MVSTRAQRAWRRALMVAAVFAGSVFATPGGCLGVLQRELEVLVSPEAAADLFMDSWLGTHGLGRQLIKFWNWRD